MNPEEVFAPSELNKIKNIGINIENRIYTPEECRIMESRIEEHIMSGSTKNNTIPELTNNFRNILTTLINAQNQV